MDADQSEVDEAQLGSDPAEAVAESQPTAQHALLNDPDSVLLVSTMKSGTHWLRYLFANYVKLLTSKEPDAVTPVVYGGLQNRFSPTDRRMAIRGETPIKRGDVYPFHGLSNVMWQHVDNDLLGYDGRIVYIYRNPLDYLVSRYHYDKLLWKSEGRACETVADTMPYSLRWYGEGLKFMLEMASKRQMIVITYENLKAATFETMSIVWASLGVPVNEALLRKAIEFSSADQVRKEEQERGAPIVGSTTEGRFVRNSSVGQWRNHFTEEDIDQANMILREYGMNLEQFRLEI